MACIIQKHPIIPDMTDKYAFKNGLPRYGEWYYGPQKWMMNNLSIHSQDSNTFFDEVTWRFAHQTFEESRINRDFNKPNREIRVEQVDASSINIDYIKKMRKGHKLFYGLEVVINDVTSKGTDENVELGTSKPGPTRYPQSTWRSMGIYLTDQWTLSDKLNLEAGLRYSNFEIDSKFDTAIYPFSFTKAQLNNGALTGSVGGIYRPSNNWVLSTKPVYRFPFTQCR